MAFSMSAPCQLAAMTTPTWLRRGGVEGGRLTSETAQPELFDIIDLVWKLVVVLDDVDVVGAGKQAGKAPLMRVPERSGDDVCRLVRAGVREQVRAWVSGILFCIRIFRLFRINRSLSRMMRRNDSGRTS